MGSLGAGLWFSVAMHIFSKLLSVTKLRSYCGLMPSLKAASKIFIKNKLILKLFRHIRAQKGPS